MDPGFTPCGYIANLLNRQPFNFNCTLRPRTENGVVGLPVGFSLSANAVGIVETQVGTGTDADYTGYTAGTNVYQDTATLR